MISRRHFLYSTFSGLALLQSRHLPAQSARDPASLELHEASALIARGSLSPIELTEACLARIGALDEGINAFITVTGAAARERARQLGEELARGHWRGPLHGIPIALKDNIDTAGVATTAASGLLADRVPQQDAPVWQRLQEAGAILLGKLNMHEFAYGGTSSVSHVGPVRNPWNPAHIPGGSSGGSAAAVAARFCVAALGTDTLASIRLPAAYCGVTGLKPTHGLCSIRGIIPVSPSLDHVGPLTRSVADSALMLDAMAGADPLDAVSIQAPAGNYVQALTRPATGLRLGLPGAPYFDNLHPDTATAVAQAIATLERLTGGQAREVVLPDPGDFVPLLAESHAWHEELLRTPANHRHYHPATLERILAAGRTSAANYFRALQAMQVGRRQIDAVFRDVDVLVAPTAPGLPEPIAGAQFAEADSAEDSTRNTAPFNLYGIPAISVPCGFSRSGLPIGLQLASAHLDEARLFTLGAAFQRVTDWHRREPQTDRAQ